MGSSSSQPASRAEVIQKETTNTLLPVSSLLHFRPNVHLPLEKLKQPEEIRVDVFTTSNSEWFHLNEIVSMVIELTSPNATSNEVHWNADIFLLDLSRSHFESLKILEILGFRLDYPFWIGLYHLCREGLHLTCPVSSRFHLGDQMRDIKKLHLKLEENFDLLGLPFLPDRLEEFSLHFSNLRNRNDRAYIPWNGFVDLKKM